MTIRFKALVLICFSLFWSTFASQGLLLGLALTLLFPSSSSLRAWPYARLFFSRLLSSRHGLLFSQGRGVPFLFYNTHSLIFMLGFFFCNFHGSCYFITPSYLWVFISMKGDSKSMDFSVPTTGRFYFGRFFCAGHTNCYTGHPGYSIDHQFHHGHFDSTELHCHDYFCNGQDRIDENTDKVCHSGQNRRC